MTSESFKITSQACSTSSAVQTPRQQQPVRHEHNKRCCDTMNASMWGEVKAPAPIHRNTCNQTIIPDQTTQKYPFNANKMLHKLQLAQQQEGKYLLQGTFGSISSNTGHGTLQTTFLSTATNLLQLPIFYSYKSTSKKDTRAEDINTSLSALCHLQQGIWRIFVHVARGRCTVAPSAPNIPQRCLAPAAAASAHFGAEEHTAAHTTAVVLDAKAAGCRSPFLAK
jgi:hypothetical protein